MDNEESIIGTDEELFRAFEKAAEMAVQKYAPEGATEDQQKKYFADRPFDARIQIIVQPHNQWVRTYSVILTG